MTFGSPGWLLLLPALVIIGWQWRRLELGRPLRALSLLLLVLALADPRWQNIQPGLDLWVMVDRSDSAKDLIGPRISEWEGMLKRSLGAQDRLRFIDFGDGAVVRADDSGTASEVPPGQTRSANALQLAILRRDPTRATRFLMLTDGFPTEPLDGLADLLVRADIPLDLRFAAIEGGTDFQVDSLDAPRRAQAGESFVMEMDLTSEGRGATTVPYQIERDGVVIFNGTADLQNGVGRVRLTDKVDQPGSVHYVARIFPEHDPRPGNNVSETWIEGVTGPRVLIISQFPDDPVAAALTAQKIPVDLENDPKNLHDGRLTGVRAVVFNNVPANLIPMDFLKSMEFYVSEQGGGVVMLGGKNSFGSGGYYGTKVADVLPVNMELRDEHRKLSVAMAISLDRSGSMRVSVPDGAGGSRPKMDLADAGTAEALRLLGPNDLVTVHAVDSAAHEIVPLAKVDPGRQEKIDEVLRIQSQGGGIFVYQALVAAWAALEKAPGGQKHIILFADANDAERPEDYVNLLEQVTKAGATVSVIGLGNDYDKDAAFLIDVAKRGNGRIFFSSDARDLPAIFSQDTVAVARSTFIDQATPLQSMASWAELAAHSIDWPADVGGYNLCYLQPKAAAAAQTADDNSAPLIAFWHRGSGRAAAVTFPLAGPFSDKLRAWPNYGEFVTTLTRWLMGPESPPGLGVKARIEGDQLVVDLLFDPEWESALAKKTPEAIVTQGSFEDRRNLEWERLEPGRFRAHTRLEPGRPAIGTIKVGEHSLPFGPLAPAANLEWHRDPAGPRALRTLAAATGGREITELRDAWRETDQIRSRSFRPEILWALIGALVAEAATTRIGVLTRWWRKRRETAA